MKEKQVLVTHEAPDGTPRAFAVGPESNRDTVREEARYRLEAFQLTRSVMGDPIGSAEFTRREVVLA